MFQIDREKMREFQSSGAANLILMRIKANGGKIVMSNEKVDVKATCQNYLEHNWDLEVFNFVKSNSQLFFPAMLDIWFSNNCEEPHWDKEFRSLVKIAVETKQPEQQLEQIASAFVRNMLTAYPVIIMCEEKAISPTIQDNGLIMLISKYCESDELFEFMEKFNIDPNCRDGIIGLMIARFHPSRYDEFVERFNYTPSETKQGLISKTLKNAVIIKKSRGGVYHVS